MDWTRDRHAAAYGKDWAELDKSLGLPPATDAQILKQLAAEAESSGDEITGWAQEACLKAYRAVYTETK